MEKKDKMLEVTKNAAGNCYSIHTLEIGISLSEPEYQYVVSYLRDYCDKYGYGVYFDKENILQGEKFCWNFMLPKSDGINHISAMLIKDRGYMMGYLFVEINARKLVGIKENQYICILPSEQLAEVMPEVLLKLKEIGIPSKICRKYYIKRIDYCTNVLLNTEEDAEAYLRLLRRGKLPYNMERVQIYSESQKRFVDAPNSFTIHNKSCEFTIYSKYAQMKQETIYDKKEIELAKGQIRIEYRLFRSKIRYIKNKYDLLEEVRLILDAKEIAEAEIKKLLRTTYGEHNFFHREVVMKKIDESNYYDKTKKAMKEFVKNANLKNGIRGAMCECENVNILGKLEELGVSPLCIPRRIKTKMFHNPLYYIQYNNVNDR